MAVDDFYETFSRTVCPSVAAVLTTLMLAAPIWDLRKALLKGKLGDLNPFPWLMMTGNCLGWIVYGYYLEPRDAFVVAADFPGFLISLWLNFGAAKLQYKELMDDMREREEKQKKSLFAASSSLSTNTRTQFEDDYYYCKTTSMPANGHHRDMMTTRNGGPGKVSGLTISLPDESIDPEHWLRQQKRRRRRQREKERKQYHPENLVSVPQEVGLFRVLLVWLTVLIAIHWIADSRETAVTTIGIVVNLNLVFLYGAPLHTMQRVIFVDRHSNSIHRPFMYMSLACSSFTFLYGVAKMDPVIMLPNAMGVVLSLAQFLLCFCFPQQKEEGDDLPTLSSQPEQAQQQHQDQENGFSSSQDGE